MLEVLKRGLNLSQDVELIIDVLEYQKKLARAKYPTPTKIYSLIIYLGEGVELSNNAIEF